MAVFGHPVTDVRNTAVCGPSFLHAGGFLPVQTEVAA